jgi:phage terminase large subunit-like protein
MRAEFSNGAVGFAYSGERPEKLRGPEHHFAWCDELAKWGRAQETWDNLQPTMRLGERPRLVVTTTPRAIRLMKAIREDAATAVTAGRTGENVHVARAFVEAMERLYGGTRLGRQELEGLLIEDVEGALWSRELIEAARSGTSSREFGRIVVGVDPPGSSEGTCGIVVCGVDGDGVGWVLADMSLGGVSPEGWARRVAAAAEAWGAHRVVAEKNNGGAMVESVLRGASVNLPVKLVSASEGKSARAEPVAALFEGGKARIAGAFPELEDEMCGMLTGGGYEGPGRSSDRADAMVWAMTELMLAKERPQPRVRFL